MASLYWKGKEKADLFIFVTLEQTTMMGIPKLVVKQPVVKGNRTWSVWLVVFKVWVVVEVLGLGLATMELVEVDAVNTMPLDGSVYVCK